MGWFGLGRIGLGPNFSTCSGLGWVSQLMGRLDRVTQNGPMDNSGVNAGRRRTLMRIPF